MLYVQASKVAHLVGEGCDREACIDAVRASIYGQVAWHASSMRRTNALEVLDAAARMALADVVRHARDLDADRDAHLREARVHLTTRLSDASTAHERDTAVTLHRYRVTRVCEEHAREMGALGESTRDRIALDTQPPPSESGGDTLVLPEPKDRAIRVTTRKDAVIAALIRLYPRLFGQLAPPVDARSMLLGTVRGTQVHLVGRCDALCENAIVEIKARARRLFGTMRETERIQACCYARLYGREHAYIVEHYHAAIDVHAAACGDFEAIVKCLLETIELAWARGPLV